MTHALLVLGAALRPDGQPGPALRRRGEYAAELALAGRADLLLLSGGGGEAEALARIATDSGLAPDRLILERQARTTWDNIQYAIPLIDRHQINGVTIVTDDYHLPRALLTARRLGLPASGAAVPAHMRATPAGRLLRLRLREAVARLGYRLRPLPKDWPARPPARILDP